MTLGFIGLGKMGQNLALHLLEQGVEVVVYNRTKEITEKFIGVAPQLSTQIKGKLLASYTTVDFIKMLPAPRVIWLMVAAGAAIDELLEQLVAAGLTTGDVVIDGGNSFYKDSIRRAGSLATRGVIYLDCGTSGGLEGGRTGACLMLGGEEAAVGKLDWLWNAVAVPGGWAYFGGSGAGHFVKMVHNGVEYGMDQALGEGFEILAKGPYKLNLAAVADNWAHGSVVRGWLVELVARALAKDPELAGLTGVIGGGETGKWALSVATELGVGAPVLEQSLASREKSKNQQSLTTKIVSALRREYGGHPEPKGSE